MENLYTISWGLAGGFGGIQNYEVIEASSLEEAEMIVFDIACENYDSYTGASGLRNSTDIMDEEDCSEEEADEIFSEEREGWILYHAIPYEENHDELYSGFHFYNSFKK